MNAIATQLDEDTVEFIRILPGPIEKVWSYLADSGRRREWLGSGDLPARIGERFSLHIKHSDYWPSDVSAGQRAAMAKAEHRMMHVLLALEPPYRLAYSFQPEGWEETMVEFRLAPEGANRVRLTLTHSKLGDRGHAVDVSHGWQGHLDILKRKLEGATLLAFADLWPQAESVHDTRC
jgi:uncharacterized protein YndB with AHSA1/START domain